MFSQAYEKFKDTGSKSSKLVVAAFDFGAIYSGCAFSWISEWSKVVVNISMENGFTGPRVPTTLILNSDQSFCAFGYKADDIYFKLTENDSEDEDDKSSKQNCNDLYYFLKLTLCLNVSKFNFMFQSYLYDNTSSSVAKLFNLEEHKIYHSIGRGKCEIKKNVTN